MPFKDPPKGPSIKTIKLAEGEYTPLPGSADRVLVGPAELRLRRWPNGGIDGSIVSGEPGDLHAAIHAKLTRVGW